MRFAKIVLAILVVSTGFNSGEVFSASGNAVSLAAETGIKSVRSLSPRVHHRPPARTVLRPWMSSDRIVLKFAEGSGVRLRNGRLVSLTGQGVGEVNRVLARAGITAGALSPVLDRPESQLAKEKALGEQRSGKQLADLSLYYFVELKPRHDPARICDELNLLELVESAVPQELPAPAPAVTPDFEYLQGYRTQVGGGLGVDAVAGVPGVDGAGMMIADIEYDWVLGHEDLMLPDSVNTDPETIDNPYPPANHGTAVLAMLVGKDNGFGITGIVPAATPAVFPTTTTKFKYNPGRAINRAAAHLRLGDVMLLEIQTWVCGTGDYGPAEWSSVVFDVVENATALGIVVVAVAGNGGVDLDQPACNGLFDRTVRDSGAIIVGAGQAGSNARTSFSTYGSRVDVQGWGDWSVVTAGYGDLFSAPSGKLERMYTDGFSGTSSATPMVAGATVAVQGALRAAGKELLDSYEMRALLTQTGTPQGVGDHAGHIGPLPNVPAALASELGWLAIDVSPGDDINYVDTDRPNDSVSVAVLTTSTSSGDAADFDVNSLDQQSVRFGSARAQPAVPARLVDSDSDGDADLEFTFTIGEAGIACEDTAVSLEGFTVDGLSVAGSDHIETPACPTEACHP